MRLAVAAVFCVSLAVSQRLFISEYYEDGSGRVAIELFNPSCWQETMADFSLAVIQNTAPYTWLGAAVYPLSSLGTINSKSTALVCNAAVTAACTTSGFTGLSLNNGYSAIGLFHNGFLIDAIGQELSYQQWTIGGVPAATADHTMVRKPWVTEGTPFWRFPKVSSFYHSEWTVTSVTTTSLGSHTVSAPAAQGLNPQNFWELTCPSSPSTNSYAVRRLTCGTTANSNIVSAGLATMQVECPLHCLLVPRLATTSAVAAESAALLAVVRKSSSICLAAIHTGNLPYTSTGRATNAQADVFTNQCEQVVSWLDASAGDLYLNRLSYRIQRGVYQYDVDSTKDDIDKRQIPRFTLTMRSGAFTFAGGTLANCITSVSAASSSSGFHITPLPETLCPSSCGEGGVCNRRLGICRCHGRYIGDDCSGISCAGTAYNGASCNTATGTWTCPADYTGDSCTQHTCASKNFCRDAGNVRRGTCDALSGACVCMAGFLGPSCAQQLCLNNCSGVGICDYSKGLCACDSTRTGDDCSLYKCSSSCSNFGTCDVTTGVCVCSSESYGAAGNSICRTGTCPSNCSGHGTCDYASRLCTCDAGWIGWDCSVAAA